MIKNYTIKVSAPQETTFFALGIQNKFNEWANDLTVQGARQIAKNGVGTKFQHAYWPFWEAEGEVIAYEEPVVFGVGVQLNIMKLRGTVFYRVDYVSDTESRFNATIDFPESGIAQKTTLQLLGPIMDRAMNSYMKVVKSNAEKQAVEMKVKNSTAR